MAASLESPSPVPAPSGPSVVVASTSGAPHPKPRFTLADLRERRSEKLVFTIFGGKNGGKTTTSYSLPGRKLVLSFDRKSQGIKDALPGDGSDVLVLDVLRYYFTQPELAPPTAATTVDFILWAIDEAARMFHPHWVIIDGTEKLEEICEMKMRYQHNLAFSEGFAERSWWKDRRAILRSIVSLARDRAELGVAFTAYYDKNIGQEGSGVTPDKTPKWVDVVLYETDITIEVTGRWDQFARRNSYQAYVQSSKRHLFDVAVTGQRFDITDKPFPWGPGLDARYRRVEEKLARIPGLTVEHPGVSEEAAESLVYIEPPPRPGGAPYTPTFGEKKENALPSAASATPPPPAPPDPLNAAAAPTPPKTAPPTAPPPAADVLI